MSGALDNRAEDAYRSYWDHVNGCPRCARAGDTRDADLCAVGYRLLAVWERAEAMVA